ncbi:hypothetical protein D9M68_886080 [compost metagenome]
MDRMLDIGAAVMLLDRRFFNRIHQRIEQHGQGCQTLLAIHHLDRRRLGRLRQNKRTQVMATIQLHGLLDILEKVIDVACCPGVVPLIGGNLQGLAGEELLNGLGGQNPFP